MKSISFMGSRFWLAILLTSVAMIVGALFFQYQLGYEPCVLCVHIRAWVIAMGLISAFALIFKKRGLRIIALLLVVPALGMFADNVIELWQIEAGYLMGTCSWSAGFPESLPLDQWFPALFEIGGICGETPEMMLGVTMAQTLMGISLVLTGFTLMSIGITIRSGLKTAL